MEIVITSKEYQTELEGKPAELFYKTMRSHTWQKANISTKSYAEYSYRYGLAVQQQEGWHQITWKPTHQTDNRRMLKCTLTLYSPQSYFMPATRS